MPLPEPDMAGPLPSPPQRLRFLDTWVDAMTVSTFLDEVGAVAHEHGELLVANHNVNSLVLLQRSQLFRDFYERPNLIFIDGTAVVALARLLGEPARLEHRIAVLDWFWPLCARAEGEGWHLVHLGGTPEVLARACEKVRDRHPALSFTALHGYFDPHSAAENGRVLEQLRDARPTVLLVGMGMPRQELWLYENAALLPRTVVITVGGILSFIGDDRPTPPRWLGRLGLEWLFRVVTEPRRLWRRYLVEPFVLVPIVAGEARKRRSRAAR